MPAELITIQGSIHYVKSTEFSPEQLNGKALRWFRQEVPLNCLLETSEESRSGYD